MNFRWLKSVSILIFIVTVSLVSLTGCKDSKVMLSEEMGLSVFTVEKYLEIFGDKIQNLKGNDLDKQEDVTDEYIEKNKEIVKDDFITDILFTTDAVNREAALAAQEAQRVYIGTIALTFDDGPSAESTVRILDILNQYNVKGTFFQVGRNVANHPEITKRVADEGHQLGNHSYDHADLTRLNIEGFTNQINSTNQEILNASGVELKLVRPTYGAINQSMKSNIQYPLILWSIDTLDWKHRNSQKVVSSVLDYVQDGDIVLMHDIYETTADACEVLVPELVNRGYKLVTVSELLEEKGITPENGEKYRFAR